MKTICRIFTAGHVDDGKSTLIGRLLYDSRSLFEDHILSLKRDSAKKGSALDYSLLTDGLKAEREQGITIDVAYRYFSTPNRTFILADSPGHEQYTRNMATAASNSDVLLLLIDAHKPISQQTRRHSLIASLLGIKRFVIAVNKMDLVGYCSKAFGFVVEEYKKFASELKLEEISFIPVSALLGDNVVEQNRQMPWYGGPTLLHKLETISDSQIVNQLSFRFPIQSVLRPKNGGRLYAGTLQMGSFAKGDEIICLPSGQKGRIRTIFHGDREVEIGSPGEALAIELDTEIDASRGALFSSLSKIPKQRNEIEATLIWMDSTAQLLPQSSYLLMHTTQMVPCKVKEIHHCIDIDTLSFEKSKELSLNDIAKISLELQKPIFADSYQESRSTGSFILIDPFSNRTVGAGLIEEKVLPKGSNLVRSSSLISSSERAEKLGQKGAVVWFTGLSGSGKTTLALALEKKLFNRGKLAYILDGDNIRHGLCRDLGFSFDDRKENIRRVGEVAALFADAGLIAITAFISPFTADREIARLAVPPDRFYEIYLSASLECCEDRDPKGHYKKARTGEIPHFTGVSSPYEPPLNPNLILDTATESVDDCVEKVIQLLREHLS